MFIYSMLSTCHFLKQTLVTLLMANNKINDKGAQYLATVLRNCGVSFLGPKPGTGNADCKAAVLGSPELLGRAVENVIRNAIAYTAEGTSVQIQLFEENRLGSQFAVLQVKDCGPGVPEAALKSIFRPFYRLDLSRQRSTGGYGVGLAITERAIRLHGGAVTARNSKEGGLIVEMRLPVAEDTEG